MNETSNISSTTTGGVCSSCLKEMPIVMTSSSSSRLCSNCLTEFIDPQQQTQVPFSSDLNNKFPLFPSSSSQPLLGLSQQQQQQQQQQPDNSHHGGDRSSSSSPGSASTSPSGGSNSNSNHPPPIVERQSITTANPFAKNINYNGNNNINHNCNTNASNSTTNHHYQHNNNSIQNQMSHCIIISPSFMVEENSSIHSNHHHPTPVFVVQQHLPSSTNALITPPTSLPIKKEKCVSDIMHEAFQLLSYWPTDHHHGLVTSENEQTILHSRLNMDEHLMF